MQIPAGVALLHRLVCNLIAKYAVAEMFAAGFVEFGAPLVGDGDLVRIRTHVTVAGPGGEHLVMSELPQHQRGHRDAADGKQIQKTDRMIVLQG